MIYAETPTATDFRIVHAPSGLALVFQCSARFRNGDQTLEGAFAAWTATSPGIWESRHPAGMLQRVSIVLDQSLAIARVGHEIVNRGSTEVVVHSLRTVTGTVKLPQRPATVHYLHSLNVRHDLVPLAALQPKQPSLMLGRVPYMFFEGLVLCQGEGQPCVVTGPLTQNLVHRCQQLTWDGASDITLHTEQDLRGIKGRHLAAGQTLTLDGVFIQFRALFDANTVFEDYLQALNESNGTRWARNPLRREHFHAPWNNYLYWEAREKDITDTAERLKRDFPTSVQWMGLDDGYEKAWVSPTLARRPNGEPKWHWETELIWGHNCPGISFGFPEGLGENLEKFPSGLLGLARAIKATGRRPMLWMGLGVSINHPLFKTHREWFLPTNNGEQGLLDVSVPEVRDRIEGVFRNYYGRHGWEAVKLDFFTHNFERTDLEYRQGNKTAAEWRAWFFEMIRRYVPDDGFISLGCDLCVGTPWVARWADSYRFSMDMRDGSWENVKSNIRWSLVPTLTHGFEQPIGDCDSVSIFRDLTLNERTCWADYSHQVGSICEISGDLGRWSEPDRAWLRGYLDEPRGGERCWIGDPAAWGRDGMPQVVSRWRKAGSSSAELITSLHNWSDTEQTLAFRDWVGPIRKHAAYENLRTGERGILNEATVFTLPARSSTLLRTSP